MAQPDPFLSKLIEAWEKRIIERNKAPWTDRFTITLKEGIKIIELEEKRKELFSNNKFIPKRLAEEIQQIYHFMTLWGQLYIYNPIEGIYKLNAEETIEKTCLRILGDKSSKHHIAEVIYAIKINNYRTYEDVVISTSKIVVKNGILNIETMKLEPFTHFHFTTTRIPINFDPKAECPQIKKFLEEICPKSEYRETLIEMIGYCLLQEYPFHVWLILVGEGRNGKSTFIELLKTFLGKENITSLSLQDLIYNRFLPSQLFGKLANLHADIPSNPLRYTGKLKMLTGGDTITCDVKHRDPIQFNNYAKLIFSCNKLPKTEDTTNAFYSRALIVEFPNQFPARDPNTDPKIIKKLTTLQELSGLLNLALQGLQNGLQRGSISYPFTTEEMRVQYSRFSDPLYRFVEERIIFEKTSETAKGRVHEVYRDWAEKHKLSIKTSNVFSREIKKYLKEVTEARSGSTRFWKGIRLASEEEVEEKQHKLDSF